MKVEKNEPRTLRDILEKVREMGIDFVSIRDTFDGTEDSIDINKSLEAGKPVIEQSKIELV